MSRRLQQHIRSSRAARGATSHWPRGRLFKLDQSLIKQCHGARLPDPVATRKDRRRPQPPSRAREDELRKVRLQKRKCVEAGDLATPIQSCMKISVSSSAIFSHTRGSLPIVMDVQSWLNICDLRLFSKACGRLNSHLSNTTTKLPLKPFRGMVGVERLFLLCEQGTPAGGVGEGGTPAGEPEAGAQLEPRWEGREEVAAVVLGRDLELGVVGERGGGL